MKINFSKRFNLRLLSFVLFVVVAGVLLQTSVRGSFTTEHLKAAPAYQERIPDFLAEDSPSQEVLIIGLTGYGFNNGWNLTLDSTGYTLNILGRRKATYTGTWVQLSKGTMMDVYDLLNQEKNPVVVLKVLNQSARMKDRQFYPHQIELVIDKKKYSGYGYYKNEWLWGNEADMLKTTEEKIKSAAEGTKKLDSVRFTQTGLAEDKDLISTVNYHLYVGGVEEFCIVSPVGGISDSIHCYLIQPRVLSIYHKREQFVFWGNQLQIWKQNEQTIRPGLSDRTWRKKEVYWLKVVQSLKKQMRGEGDS